MLDKARYIVVEGPIGAGKTTLARRLAERLNGDTLLENPAANPFLGRFYQNMERWGLPTQIAFLFQRSEQLAACPDDPHRRLVSDFLIDKDPLFAELNLAEDELKLYRQLYERLKPSVRKPDLVIYLQAQPDILIDRVRKRGVESERKISEPYLQRVAERYATSSTTTMQRPSSSSMPSLSTRWTRKKTSSCSFPGFTPCAAIGSSSATPAESV